MQVARGHEARLVRIHVVRPTVRADYALAVAHDDVLAQHAEPHVVLGRGDGGRAGAGEHDLDLSDVLADHFERVEQGGAGDDGGAVLVVVEDRNRERLPERFLDQEAFRRLDVLEVDAANSRLQQLAEPDDILRVLGVDLEVEDIDVRELLEQVALAFHHRLAGERADISQAEHRSTVRHDGDEVALRRVGICLVGVPLDLEAGLRDTGRVRESQIPLVRERLRRNYCDLARAAGPVIFECVVPSCSHSALR